MTVAAPGLPATPMLVYFARQDLAQRFTGNALGIAWAVLAPLLQLALFAFIFIFIFKARVPGLDGLGYVAFLSLGMWPWFAFSEAVTRSTTALTEQASLLGKVAVPPATLVGARVLTAFGLHGFGFLLIVALLALLPVDTRPWLLPLTLLAWAGMAVLSVGVGLLLAVGNVFIRDLQQIVAYVLPALMFLSPILYTVEMAPEPMRPWMALNPIAGFVDAVRGPLLFGDLAPVLPWSALLVSGALLLLALAFYRRLRGHVVDFL
jgi:lipopolysaccharide transport system permease protein